MKKSPWRIIIIIIAVLVVVGAGLLILHKPKKRRYKTATVTKGEILSEVSATGNLNPVNQVIVGSQVSGIIDTVLVDYNSQVKAGQVLARIDPRNYQSALLTAQANLTSAQVSLEQDQRLYSNAESLFPAKLVSEDQLIQTKTTYELDQSKLTQAQANYNQAQTNLAYTTITSPMTGVVVDRTVSGGQTVAASFSAPELFQIADLSKMQVEISIQEADVGKLDTGMVATFQVDAYPSKTFTGKLVQIRNNPITSSNVVTYIGIVYVDNSDFLLKPGMTADVKIIVTDVQNVLVVPSTALNPKMGSLLGLVQSHAGKGASSGGANAGVQGGPSGVHPGAGAPAAAESGASSATGGQGKRPHAAESLATRAANTQVKKAQTLYVLQNGAPTAREVQVGANDGSNTQITSGLNEGDVVILGLDQGRVNPFAQSQQGRPPTGGLGR